MKYLALILTIFLIGWIMHDLARQEKGNLRQFDPHEVARLDASMWQLYYQKKPARLFWQLARITRQQAHATFWRSVLLAYHATRAAFSFQKGSSRAEYQRALPSLQRYYAQLYALSDYPFDINLAARTELEWWIIRREREAHPPRQWTELQARVTATLYGMPAEKFITYAQYRTDAMLYRDQRGESMKPADWQMVEHMLEKSWTELHRVLTRP